ncbi:hypothetical protein CRX45_00010 [Escherichia coli]|nr:hypothetical protein CRX45_00010 [Escherichia coli]
MASNLATNMLLENGGN